MEQILEASKQAKKKYTGTQCYFLSKVTTKHLKNKKDDTMADKNIIEDGYLMKQLLALFVFSHMLCSYTHTYHIASFFQNTAARYIGLHLPLTVADK